MNERCGGIKKSRVGPPSRSREFTVNQAHSFTAFIENATVHESLLGRGEVRVGSSEPSWRPHNQITGTDNKSFPLAGAFHTTIVMSYPRGALLNDSLAIAYYRA